MLLTESRAVVQRRSVREDHPFASARAAYFRTKQLLELDPDNEGLQARFAAAEAEAQAYLDELLMLPPWNRILRDYRRKEDAPRKAELLQILLRDTRIRAFQPGEVIVRQGDYGTSAFIILAGRTRVVLSGLDAVRLGKNEPRRKGPLRAFYEWLVRPGREVRDLSQVAEAYKGPRGFEDDYVPIFIQDLPRVIERHGGVSIELGLGEIFGEISALGRIPRTATVVAEATETSQETRLLEIRWQGVRDLRRHDAFFQRYVDRTYRRNSLHEHLRATSFTRRVGDTPGIRACLREGSRDALRRLFREHLGWEAHSDAVDVGHLAFRLRVISGAEAGLVIPCPSEGALSIGRGVGADLQVLEETVSREHAQIVARHGRRILQNRSRYGTVVGDEFVGPGQELPLAPGSVLLLGDLTRVVFEIDPERDPETPPSVRATSGSLERVARSNHEGTLAVDAYHLESATPPSPEQLASIRSHVRARSPRYILMLSAGDERRWLWHLPDEVASFSGDTQLLAPELKPTEAAARARSGPQDCTFSAAAPEPILERLVRELALEELARATEFRSFGKFLWSRRTAEEKEAGTDWSRLSQEQPLIASQGGYPNGVILLRSGFARLSRAYEAGERTLSYVGRGAIYGFEEIAHNARVARGEGGEPVQLQHTLRALGHADILFIPTRTLELLVLPAIPPDELPPLIPSEVEVALPAPAPALPEGTIEFLVEHRLMNGTAAMAIDLDRCTRCDDCVRACAAAHEHNPRFLRHGPRHRNVMIANACMHCADPVCMIACPTGAIHRSAAGGQVVIKDTTCIGCESCASNCPYDNIRMVPIRDDRDRLVLDPNRQPYQRATKCDLCYDQSGPACVRACPHDALERIDLSDVDGLARWLAR